MKTIRIFTTAILLCALNLVYAQDLPKPSPLAMVMQRVGLTDITIEYSSPGIKGRTVWGDLVPYDKLWRTGANKSTKISFSQDVMLEGNKVPAGDYSLFSIPGKDEWTMIINKETDLSGTNGYDEAKDLVRFKVKPSKSAMRERLAFMIIDFSMEEATIVLEWGELQVPIKVKVMTDEQAKANIDETIGMSWRTYANSARYLLEYGNDLDKALEHINVSLTLKEEWYNSWIKAQILHKHGNNKEALKYAKKAKELGDKSQGFFYKDLVEKALVEWKK